MDIENIILSFVNYDLLPELMQGAAGAIITLQISFAIGILIELFRDKKEPAGGIVLREMLDEVWQFKEIISLTLITFCLPALLHISSVSIKILILIIWIRAFHLLIQPLYKLYEWVKGSSTDTRLNYLNKLAEKYSDTASTDINSSGEITDPNFRDIIESWKSLWSMQTDSRFKDKEYFNLFAKQIDNLIAKDTHKNLRLIEGLLTSFVESLQNRDIFFLTVFDDFFPKILNWNHLIWQKEYLKSGSNPSGESLYTNNYVLYFNIKQNLESIISYVTDKSLSNGYSFSYFKNLNEHLTQHKDDVIDSNIYVDHFHIYRDILEKINDATDSYDVWNHYFPSSWKITTNNFKDNILTRIWYKYFIDWAESRIWKAQNSEWDHKLDEICRELFPNVDPSLWSRVLMFILSPWNGSRIKIVLEKRRSFGFMGRIVSSFNEEGDSVDIKLRKSLEEQKSETVELSLLLFKDVFTLENVKKYIEEIKLLEYPQDSRERDEQDLWLNFLDRLRKRLSDDAL